MFHSIIFKQPFPYYCYPSLIQILTFINIINTELTINHVDYIVFFQVVITVTVNSDAAGALKYMTGTQGKR